MNSVVIAYCHPDHIPALFASSLTRLLLADRDTPLIADVYALLSSPRIASARNTLVRTFLDNPDRPPWLLMLDADMVFTPDLVDKLLYAADPLERPIVAGLYFGGKIDGKQIPHIYVLNADQSGFHPVEGMKGGWGPVVKIHAAGAGCLLMHRDALAKIGDKFADTGFPWFAEGRDMNGQEVGEDIAFCMRAHSLDIPIHAHTGVILGHVKYGIIDEASYQEYQEVRDTFGDDKINEALMGRYRCNAQVIPDA